MTYVHRMQDIHTSHDLMDRGVLVVWCVGIQIHISMYYFVFFVNFQPDNSYKRHQGDDANNGVWRCTMYSPWITRSPPMAQARQNYLPHVCPLGQWLAHHPLRRLDS